MNEVDLAANSTAASTSSSTPDGGARCLVCGDAGASQHYGALACIGCKGFFRRALKKADQLECLGSGSCPIRLGERTLCRSCRLRKCLQIGMQPASVRPDRPAQLSKQPLRARRSAAAAEASSSACKAAASASQAAAAASATTADDDWMRRLNVEMKTTLMTLLNVEAKIAKGDTHLDASKLYPLHVSTLREIFSDPGKLKGKRSQMRYEAYRMAANTELLSIAYRRLIAAIDWVEFLAEIIEGGLSVDDRVALVRACFAPLMVFAFAARTSQATQDQNVLCLCNFAFVPREMSSVYADSYHLANGLVDRALDELVSPYRLYGLIEEEYVCISAIIVLNPLARDLSEEAAERVLSLRHRVQDALYAVVKESRPTRQATVAFGQLLLSLVPVQQLAGTMCENLQFAQTFSSLGGMTLLTNLFGCFPVEPFNDFDSLLSRDAAAATRGVRDLSIQNQASTKQSRAVQTVLTAMVGSGKRVAAGAEKRRRPPPQRADDVDDEETEGPSAKGFRLLHAPCHYTLTEMFDDLERTMSPWSDESPSTSACAVSSSTYPHSTQLQVSPSAWGHAFSSPVTTELAMAPPPVPMNVAAPLVPMNPRHPQPFPHGPPPMSYAPCSSGNSASLYQLHPPYPAYYPKPGPPFG